MNEPAPTQDKLSPVASDALAVALAPLLTTGPGWNGALALRAAARQAVGAQLREAVLDE